MKIIITELGILLTSGRVARISTDHYLPEKLLRIYLLTILASSIAVFIAFVPLRLGNVDVPFNTFQESLKQHSLAYQIVVFCLLAPIQQEIKFRLCLIYSKINIAGFLGIWCFFLLNKLNEGKGLFGEQNPTSLNLGLSLIAMASVYSCLLQNKEINNKLETLWMTYSKPVFLISILCFALFHVASLDKNLLDLRLIPILLLPPVLSGLIFGYTRLKYGVRYSLLLHIGYNVVCVFLPFLNVLA
ncbi:type II CAAX prenyl endopeptidase Rce1 family protein [Dyadobacter sp. LHD-138]|uniref:CPBP family glutamic-type intramembrane protease n=1 Tax=Dyadobacter sp. LHD-138 TaxID=3071413 RepID=UPI0027E1A0CF|nr:CPBP family glutamic-type intramembrane protease [Dyadobacter sp. LHD-138]MDQ6477767.1 CPBP family glutamic-type intramembrane protease [Dyadobacter sp. LHD-138]